MEGQPRLGDHSGDSDAPGASDVEDLVGELGVAMLAAGYAVTDVGTTLHAVAAAHGQPLLTVGAIPTAILIDDPVARRARIAGMEPGTAYRFDQTQAVGRLASLAALAAWSPRVIRDRLADVAAMPAPYPPWAIAMGNALVAGGVSIVFRTTWLAVAVDCLLGLVVGAVLLWTARAPRLASLMPFILGFVASGTVFAVAHLLDVSGAPLYAVFAPIVVLVPGAAITNAVIELAAGDVVSGGGRLIGGLVTWLMLLLGILVGAAANGASLTELVLRPPGALPGWAAWPGLLIMGVGIALSNCAPPRLGVVVVVVLLATYALLVGVGSISNSIIGSGVAAAVMLVATRLVEQRRAELPAIVTFRPAFWLLVPGSMGLASLAQFAGDASDTAQSLLVTMGATVLAISIGVQLGAVVSEAVGWQLSLKRAGTDALPPRRPAQPH